MVVVSVFFCAGGDAMNRVCTAGKKSDTTDDTVTSRDSDSFYRNLGIVMAPNQENLYTNLDICIVDIPSGFDNVYLVAHQKSECYAEYESTDVCPPCSAAS